jgi:glycerol-3-phosphate cytidylyltransferase-like family protein
VIIGLNTDEFIKKYKGRPPIMTYDERHEMIGETGIVDLVLPNGQEKGDAKDIILKSDAKLIVVGSDLHRKDNVGQLGIDWDWLDEHNIGIAYVNYTPGVSTTEIKRRINDLANNTDSTNRG